MAGDENQEPVEGGVSAVALKLPAIWPSNMVRWFNLVEAQFVTRNIVRDETKFNLVLAVLDEATMEKAGTVIDNPPADGKYDALKRIILDRTSLSDFQRAQRLLRLPDLGDRRPSQLLEEMQAVRGKMDLEQLFRALFLERLPEDVRTHFASSQKDILTIAKEADDLVASKSTPHGVSPVFKGSAKGKLCFYHKRFGKKAHRCVAPCAFASTNFVDTRQQQNTSENEYAGHQ